MNKQWHAIYTRSNFEKKVYEALTKLGIETFLPLTKELHQWKDRKKIIEVPLFRSYCFVKVDKKEYYKVFEVKGIVKYIWFNGKPAIIKEKEIEMLKKLITLDLKINVVSSDIKAGQKVKVISGSLMGYVGEVIKEKSKDLVLFRIENFPYSPAIEIAKKYLEVL
ncbi:MAG: UpxY family transcription antiterminator [Bacteroidales bacterium]|nr:UpxY family transcription antiterminator [Bacteroidales bacterium]